MSKSPTDISIEAELSREWHAWVGSPDDLGRLGTEFDRIFASELKAAEKPEPGSSDDDESDPLDESIQEIRRWLEKGNRVELTVEESRPARTVSGRVDEVLAEVDARHARTATLRSPTGSSRTARVSFTSSSCQLHVSGDETRWVRSATENLAAQIEANIPRWHLLRSPWAGLLYGPLVSLLGLAVTYPIEFTYSDSEEATTLFDVIFWLVFVAVISGALLVGLARKLLPGFELTGVGGRARSERVFSAIRGLALLVAGALLTVFIERLFL